MKNFLILSLFLLALVSCMNEEEVKKTIDKVGLKKEITILLNDWHKAASNANYTTYFDKMDSISVFIGTDATENWTKKEFEAYSKPYFDNGKAWDFKVLERNIYVNEIANFVWFDELLNTQMGTCRGSGVLEKTDGIWKIKHYVLSVSIPNDDIQKVILAKKENDALFLKKYE